MLSWAKQNSIKKDVKANGHIITSNWRELEIAPPDNLQDKIKTNEGDKKSDQRETKSTSSVYKFN